MFININKVIFIESLKYKKPISVLCIIILLLCVATACNTENIRIMHVESKSMINQTELEINDIPQINNDFSFEIPNISPAEVILIGKINFENDNKYYWSLSAETNEEILLIGLSDNPYEKSWEGQPKGAWSHWLYMSGNYSDGIWQFPNDTVAYVYLVSGSSAQNGRITEIIGNIINEIVIS
jgi:hypothetical protein